MSVKDRSSDPGKQVWVVYWRIWDFLGPTNILASLVTELDNTLPYLMDDRREGAWATHGVSVEAYVWKTYTRVRWARLNSLIVIVNCCHLWCPPGPRVLCCQVISLASCKIDLSLRDYYRCFVCSSASARNCQCSTSPRVFYMYHIYIFPREKGSLSYLRLTQGVTLMSTTRIYRGYINWG
jgi:hypothetical protein